MQKITLAKTQSPNHTLFAHYQRLMPFVLSLLCIQALLFPNFNLTAESRHTPTSYSDMTLHEIISSTVKSSNALEYPALLEKKFNMIDLLEPIRSFQVLTHLTSSPQLLVYKPSSAITIREYLAIQEHLQSKWDAECLMSKAQYRRSTGSAYYVEAPTCFIQAINPMQTDQSFVVYAIYIYDDNFSTSSPELFLIFNPLTQQMERFDANYLFGIDYKYRKNKQDLKTKIETPEQFKANIDADFRFIKPTYHLININGHIYTLQDQAITEDKIVETQNVK